MHRNKSVNTHAFSMIPRADIPRSSFRMEHVYKTAFNAGYLIPIYIDEMLPGDTFNLRMTAFTRLATPLFPTLDNLHLDCFFFVIPNRLLWNNWQRFQGERDPDPSSSISYVIPQMVSPTGGYAVGSLQDYMGIPTTGQLGAGFSHNTLPCRAYNLVWNEWFRDQNLQNSETVDLDDGPDDPVEYGLLRRGKRHDYFTSCLPFTQKGAAATIGFGATAPVIPDPAVSGAGPQFTSTTSGGRGGLWTLNATQSVIFGGVGSALGTEPVRWLESQLVADLSGVNATVNALRQSFQIQKLLERDARGGTRYTEMLRAHFGVTSPDARLQRPEYVGGTSSAIVINPIAQTSATAASGTDTPQGNLAAVGTGLTQTGFSYSATEHCYVLGLVAVRADLTYQQGVRKLWSRSTRYDFYMPVFAALGEQAVLNKEIYAQGTAADNDVFGYQERWAEYRYFPSMITGLMRSTAAQTIDPWHYSLEFGALPTLNTAFISDISDSAVERATAVGSSANGQQFLFDAFFTNRAARPMPLYSVPGLVDHF